MYEYLQNPEERRANFKVLAVETENLTLTDFMNDKSIPSTERKQVFVELSPEEKVPPLSLLHYVEVATIDDSKVSTSCCSHNIIIILACMLYIRPMP